MQVYGVRDNGGRFDKVSLGDALKFTAYKWVFRATEFDGYAFAYFTNNAGETIFYRTASEIVSEAFA